MQYQVICEECDSEYQIHYEYGLTADEPKFCAFCKNPITPELIDDETT